MDEGNPVDTGQASVVVGEGLGHWASGAGHAAWAGCGPQWIGMNSCAKAGGITLRLAKLVAAVADCRKCKFESGRRRPQSIRVRVPHVRSQAGKLPAVEGRWADAHVAPSRNAVDSPLLTAEGDARCLISGDGLGKEFGISKASACSRLCKAFHVGCCILGIFSILVVIFESISGKVR